MKTTIYYGDFPYDIEVNESDLIEYMISQNDNSILLESALNSNCGFYDWLVEVHQDDAMNVAREKGIKIYHQMSIFDFMEEDNE